MSRVNQVDGLEKGTERDRLSRLESRLDSRAAAAPSGSHAATAPAPASHPANVLGLEFAPLCGLACAAIGVAEVQEDLPCLELLTAIVGSLARRVAESEAEGSPPAAAPPAAPRAAHGDDDVYAAARAVRQRVLTRHAASLVCATMGSAKAAGFPHDKMVNSIHSSDAMRTARRRALYDLRRRAPRVFGRRARWTKDGGVSAFSACGF